jgi:hypothetical protein
VALLATPVAALTTLDVRIAASNDDAEENGGDGGVDVESRDLDLVRSGGEAQTIGLRFPDLPIPAAAEIQAAWLQFEADEIEAGSSAIVIEGDTTEAAGVYLPTPTDLTSRPRTTASVAWNPPPWLLVGEQGPAQRTPSLVPVIQELVDAPGWVSGDTISLLVSGTGKRVARSFDGLALGAPLLHVAFEDPSNHRPVLAVTSPLPGATGFESEPVEFTTSAMDLEAGDLSAGILWTSDRDGVLGVGASFSRSDLSLGMHVLTATVSDGQGGTTTRTQRLTVFAPTNVVLGAGDIGSCGDSGDDATGALLEAFPGLILGLGDYAYPDSSPEDFENCFGPAWGRHKARIRPIPGNEYQQPDAAPYFDYFGAAAGDPERGWYSFDVGAWHVVALNGACHEIGGCNADSPEGQWLEADLSQSTQPCTLATIHEPRFSSGQIGVDDSTLDLWQILYAHGADVLLQGDDHAYERFARMSPSGLAEPLRGIRSFIAGSGGRGLHSAEEAEPNSEARDDTTYGVLQLTLEPTSYSWQFLGAGPGTFTDSGSEECVYEAPVVTITSPATGTNFPNGATVHLSASVTDLEQGDLSAQTVWRSSKDGPLGSGATLDVTLTTGSHKLFARVTDATGLEGDDQVSVNISAPSGGGGGCGIGPELMPGLALLSLLRRRQRGASTAIRKRPR